MSFTLKTARKQAEKDEDDAILKYVQDKHKKEFNRQEDDRKC